MACIHSEDEYLLG